MRTRGEQDANLRPISVTLRERSSASVRFARSHRGNEVDSALRAPHSAFLPPPSLANRTKPDESGFTVFFTALNRTNPSHRPLSPALHVASEVTRRIPHSALCTPHLRGSPPLF